MMVGAFLWESTQLERLLYLHTDSRLESLWDARSQVRDALARTRLSPQAAAEMEVAAGELLSNTHLHAYYSGVGPVFVEVFHLRWTVSVVVIDMGDAVVAPVVPSTLPYHTRKGGRGLYLASHLCDEVQFAVNRIGHGLAVRATKWFEDGLRWSGRAEAMHMFKTTVARDQLRQFT